MLKIAGWNVNSLRVRLPQVIDWLEMASPDVLVLQETKVIDEQFPKEELEAAGYEIAFSGQKTYNGVAILSRKPMTDVSIGMPNYDDEAKRVIAATVDGVRILNLYVPNGASVDSEKYQYKLSWLAALQDYVASVLKQTDKLVILGDFNIAPKDEDVHDPEAWGGQVLVSDAERTALKRLQELGLKDSFRLFEQAEKSFSWWDYRAAGFRRNRGLRIDLVLSSLAMADKCTGSGIDKEPRKWERPSDHAPIWASYDV